jgi:hypothetical protein
MKTTEMTTVANPKYPVGFKVDSDGGAGNAYAIVSHTVKLLKEEGATQAEIAEYKKSAMSGDYDNLLATTRQYVRLEMY